MWNQAFQAQSQILEACCAITHEANESIKTGLENLERLQQQQVQALREALEHNGQLANRLWQEHGVSQFFDAQSQLAVDQFTQGMALWRNVLHAMQGSQAAMMSAAQAQMGQAANMGRRAYHRGAHAADEARKGAESAAQTVMSAAQAQTNQAADMGRTTVQKGARATEEASRGAESAVQAGAWNGEERRAAAANAPHSGPERRSAA